MRNEFTAIFEMDDDRVEPRYVAYCAEIPGVNAEGNTMDEVRANLTEAVSRALEERRAKTMREVLYDISPNATRETVVVQSLRRVHGNNQMGRRLVRRFLPGNARRQRPGYNPGGGTG